MAAYMALKHLHLLTVAISITFVCTAFLLEVACIAMINKRW
ncbi:Uncharacterised protein [Serratia fonticola]|uniref:Uncharacterized protein n=1 Tax=Serratia fonticola TaxID=47917 RepID=A0A4U9TCC5_SERFO|nr:Uncharacterised protein [Serratia fonticola]